jgi:hypothetical protein
MTVSILGAPAAIDAGVRVTLTGQAFGGQPPYSPVWSLATGSILTGWSVDWTSPSTSQTVLALFEVQDRTGWVASTTTSIRVVPDPFVELAAPHALGDIGLPFLFNVTVTGGVGPFALDWSVVNGTSTGSTVLPYDGTYVGAVVPSSPGPVWIVGSIVDHWNRSFSGSTPVGRATAPPSLAPETVPFAEVGYPTLVSVAVAEGAPPFVWSAPAVAGVSMELPPDGTLPGDGPLTFRVTFDHTGNYSLPVRVEDASGAVRETNVSVVVTGGLNLSVALGSPTTVVAETVSVVATISGGLPPYFYRFSLSDNEQTSGNASFAGPVRWSATPVSVGYLTLRGTVVDGTGRVANVTLTLYITGSPGAAVPSSNGGGGAGPLAIGAAAAGAVLALVAGFVVRRWWRWPKRAGRTETAGRSERAVVRELLADAEEGIDRATLELLAEERRLSPADVSTALAAWQRVGRVRIEEADDGREVVRWVPASPTGTAAGDETPAEAP